VSLAEIAESFGCAPTPSAAFAALAGGCHIELKD
jgi:hypothetical protein